MAPHDSKRPEEAHASYLDQESARIKNIYIELPDYEYFHSPSGISRKDKRLIGRKKVKQKLKTILRNSKTKAGAYLVTGYRGMGKTSLVREIIADLKEDAKYHRIHVTFLLALLVSILLGMVVRGITGLILEDQISLFSLESLSWGATSKFTLSPLILYMTGFLLNTAFVAYVWGRSKLAKKSGWNQFWLLQMFNREQIPPTSEILHRLHLWIWARSCKNQTLEIEASLSKDDIQELDFLRLLAKKMSSVYDTFSRPGYSYLNTLKAASIWLFFICLFLASQPLIKKTAEYFFLNQTTQVELGGAAKDRETLLKNINVFARYSGIDVSVLENSLQNLEKILLDPETLVLSTQLSIPQSKKLSREEYLLSLLLAFPVFLFGMYLLFYKGRDRLLRWYGYPTRGAIRSRLNLLVDKIDTTLTMERTRGAVPTVAKIGLFQLGQRTQKEFPTAGTKEIEFELIDILDDIDQMGRWGGYKPRFIAVFDELDKIQLDFVSQMEEEEARTSFQSHQREYVTRKLRERREKISNILANLKHFLNVAKAKFVFIAGREMFDASLADISDRDFFLGSIFHDIVYVDSFLKDSPSESSHGISHMIEKYVCRFLMGVDTTDLAYRLENYFDQISYQGERDSSSAELQTQKAKISSVKGNKSSYEKNAEETENRITVALGELEITREKMISQEQAINDDERKIRPLLDTLDESRRKKMSKYHDDLYFKTYINLCDEFKEFLLKKAGHCALLIKRLMIEEKIASDVSLKSELKGKIERCKIEIENLEKQARSIEKSLLRNESKILKAQKVIAVLQSFIIYLVYRSNGTPKKVTHLFEKYIFEFDPKDSDSPIKDKQKNLIINRPQDDKSTKKFYLLFDYNDQYQFSLISYLFRPYLISTSQYMKSFGDKLLFSTSFLVDHIFKFHPWAFSWRTLELTPELVFASKSPELRSFIGTLMGSLQRTHIREIVYGVFEFKFYNKIRHEISFISKIREEESAAFNFTLDESMHIKVHFQKRIRKLMREYQDHPARREGDFFHSLCFLHSTLGDIYYYDQEFDEALLSYSESVAIYRKRFPDHFLPHQLTNWMKDSLKMGLTYEKMRSNDDAFSVYEGLLIELDDFFGLKKNFSAFDEPQPRRAEFAKALFENLRFFQLPFVAKLVLIEKEGISGISYMDIKNNEERMRKLLRMCLEKPKQTWELLAGLPSKNVQPDFTETQEYLVRTYYHLNVGAVLFFKNGAIIHAQDELSDPDRRIWAALEKNTDSQKRTQKSNERYKIPRSATIEYYKSFLYLLARIQAYSDDRTAPSRSSDPGVFEIEETALVWIKNRIKHSLGELRKNIKSIHPSILDSIGKGAIGSYNLFNTWVKKPEERFSANAYIVLSRILKAIPFNVQYQSKNGQPLVSLLPRPIYLMFATSVWFFYLKPKDSRFINKDKNLLATISAILSKLGDTLLCYVNDKIPFDLEKWTYLFDVQHALLLEETNDPKFPHANPRIDLTQFKSDDLFYYVVFFYLLSGQFYLKAGRHQNFEFQLRKILYLAKDYVSVGAKWKEEEILKEIENLKTNDSNNNKAEKYRLEKELETAKNEKSELSEKFVGLLKKEIVRPSLRAMTWANDITNRPQLFKLKNTFQMEDDSNLYESKTLYQFLSNSPESTETVLLMAEIELKLYQREQLAYDQLSFTFGRPLFNPYTNYPTKFVRMHQINFKAQVNFGLLFFKQNPEALQEDGNNISQKAGKLAQALVLKSIDKERKKYDEDREDPKTGKKFWDRYTKHFRLQGWTLNVATLALSDSTLENQGKNLFLDRKKEAVQRMEVILAESLFCLVEFIKIVEIFGVNYMTNHTYLGYGHAKLGDWCMLYESYLDHLPDHDKKDFRSILKETVETSNISYLEPKYHYELAVMHFYSAIGMHNDGKDYHQQLKTMYFLEDDFNDNMYHFSAALERYKINIGAIQKKIDNLKLFKDLSKTYNYESYVNRKTPWDT